MLTYFVAMASRSIGLLQILLANASISTSHHPINANMLVVILNEIQQTNSAITALSNHLQSADTLR